MKTKIKTKRRIVFCGVAAVFLLTVLFNFALAKQKASAAKVYEDELYDRAPGNSLSLDATIIKSWALPSGYTSAQSFAINDDDFVVIAAPRGGNKNGGGLNEVIAINRSSKQANGVAFQDMGHANGATWDSKRNQLLVVDGKNVYRFDDDYKYIDTKSTLNSDGEPISASGIAYDNLHDQYWTSIKAGGYETAIRKVNMSNWKTTTVVKENHTQVNQDLAYYHGYAYRILWTGNNSDYAYKNGHFQVNSGVILQFGDDGTFTGSFYMPNISCELESAAFAGDEMYLLYNNCGSNGSRADGYYAIAKVSNTNKQLKKMYHRFNVNYDANGGTGAPSSYVTHVGIPSKLSKTVPTRENYKFLGWSTNKNATKKEYASGAEFVRKYSTIKTNTEAVEEQDVTLYAVWEEQKYTVNYNANGGTGAPASQTADKTQNITLSSTIPTRTNYTFLGWSTSKTATTATYQPGDSFTSHENTTLYAVWRGDTYTVRYNAAGGTGAPSAQSAAKTTNITLSSTIPTRTDFDFLGWATSAGGTVVYHPGDSYTGREDITLYAVWSVQTYTISFNANGGSGAPSAMRVAKVASSVKIPATRPTRSGYTFRGWATSASSTTVAYNAGDNYTNKSDITLYAVWEENSTTPTITTIEINYDANGGENAPAATVSEPGSITLSSETPTRDGYSFLGWSTASDATTATYQAGATAEFNVDTLLYAVWSRSTITLSYDANGGSGAPAAHSGAVGEITVSTTEPTREGYSFDGWAITQGESASYQPGDLYRGSVSRKLYAVWSQQTVNINYHYCKSVANPVSAVQKVVASRRATIPAGEPTRKAYYFLGWSTGSCLGTAEYDPGDSIYVGDSDIELYAIWGDARFTIRFDVNGGSSDTFDDIIGDDNDVVIPEREPHWDGYVFKGWDEDPEATTATYHPGDTISSETDLMLYAVWEKSETGEPSNGRDDDPYDSDYDNTDGSSSSDESGAKNPKTSVSNLIGPISILPIGLISFMVVVIRRRRS